MGYSTFKKKRDAIADLKGSWDLLNSNFDKFKENYDTFEVIRVGRFLEGKGFYHEVNEAYTKVLASVEDVNRVVFPEHSART